ncbi:MAG TPA: PBP1A family penicillin-binding protein [Abditibacteriaceae bacterium]|jgi:penicillin-binding protein 1A
MQQAGSPNNIPSTTSPARTQSLKGKAAKRYPHSFWWYLKMLFIGLQMIVFCLIVVTVAVGKGIYDRLSQIVPDVHFIEQRNKAEATQVWSAPDTNGKRVLLAEFKGQHREWVPIEDLKMWRKYGNKAVQTPGRLMDATLSIEDVRFYTHPGMDAKRITKAAWVNLTSGNPTAQGGSTITEQLARNIYFRRNKSTSQRLQAALLSLQLERKFTKDEILEMYLNEIFYGNNADGCEAAARTYFDKSAKNLTISEAAFLAGLPNSPSYLDPFDHFDRAQKRQRIVLREMFENKKINYTQWMQARNDTTLQPKIAKARARFIEERRKEQRWKAPYFVSYVKQYLQKQYGWSDEYLNKAGLQIYTTVDPKLQSIADMVMRDRLNDLGRETLQGAMVCIDPWTGHVLAMVGGRDYYNTKLNGQFNRATQAKRQPGSSFKPYIYATAMEAGYTPDSVEIDKPFKLWGKQFKNYEGPRVHYGAITLRKAIGISNNIVALKTMLKLGNTTESAIQNVVQKAHLMGIDSALQPVPALALGASEVSVLEHTSAFGVFATRGMRAEETPIERVINATGELVIDHAHPVKGARVLGEQAGAQMWDMLRYVVTSGTGRVAQIDGVDVIGKTGTTSSNKDVWFMGATRQLVCGVWMGYDKQRDLGYGSAGGRWCAPAWRSFMWRALEVWRTRNPVERMIEDARTTDQQRLKAAQYKKYIERRICSESGLLANANCPDTTVAQFSSGGGVPTEHCSIPAHMTRARSRPSLSDGVPATYSPDDLGINDSAPARRDNSGATQSVDPYNGSEDTGDTIDETAPIPEGGATDVPADNYAPPEISPDGSEDAPVRRFPASYNSNRSNDTSEMGSETGNSEVVVNICADSGMVARRSCPVTSQRFFERSQAPRRRCTLHTG